MRPAWYLLRCRCGRGRRCFQLVQVDLYWHSDALCVASVMFLDCEDAYWHVCGQLSSGQSTQTSCSPAALECLQTLACAAWQAARERYGPHQGALSIVYSTPCDTSLTSPPPAVSHEPHPGCSRSLLCRAGTRTSTRSARAAGSPGGTSGRSPSRSTPMPSSARRRRTPCGTPGTRRRPRGRGRARARRRRPRGAPYDAFSTRFPMRAARFAVFFLGYKIDPIGRPGDFYAVGFSANRLIAWSTVRTSPPY